MSRCFPFPPPGYERKLDDTDLLKKEKLKEKKHKKDKKAREKRNSKHKEKKDKHREKKKDKHREKKKDKEKRVDTQFKSQNWDPLFQNNELNNQKNGSLGHKELFVQPQDGGHKDLLTRKGEHIQPYGQYEKRLVNLIKSEDTKISRFVQEIDRRISEEENRAGSLQFSEIKKSNVDHMSTGQNMINGERKDLETNGFSHEHEPRPNKTARPTSSILTENGKPTGLTQPGKSTDAMEQKVNGTITSQPPIASQILVKPTSARSPPVNMDRTPGQPLPAPEARPPSSVPNHITNQPLPVSLTKPSQPLLGSKRKESTRPPHPDTKYLKRILAVPELDRWLGLDNQEWLFSSKTRNGYINLKEKIGHSCLQDNKEVEVWCEAKRLESVGVCALPYVVPY